MEFDVSSATVDLAAEAVGVEVRRICKTMSFLKPESTGAILVQMAGDGRIDNRKFKDTFGFKAKMLKPEEVIEYTDMLSAEFVHSPLRGMMWMYIVTNPCRDLKRYFRMRQR